MRDLCFDAEADGLYGEVFAIAAVAAEADGRVTDRFAAAYAVPGVTDPWTAEHCLPLPDSYVLFESREGLLNAFWDFYLRFRDDCVIVADVPYPVEADLLRACVALDTETRAELAPYPLIDAASVLFAHGIDPNIDRYEFSGASGKKHDPLSDAEASLKCLLKLMAK